MQIKLSSPVIYVADQPIDFRRSINGLCAIVCEQFQADLKQGIFIFYNRHRDKVKILAWHRNGFLLLMKRLEQGKFTVASINNSVVIIDERQLSWLLAGLDWVKMSSWSELEYDDFS